MKAKILITTIITTTILFLSLLLLSNQGKIKGFDTPFISLDTQTISRFFNQPQNTPTPTIEITPTPTASPTATPTPTPLSFTDMNRLYGPCAVIPTLMYHHIQPADIAKSKNQNSLTVYPEWLEKHLQYLSEKNYHPISMSQLISFFDSNTPLPSKPFLITLDDGYQDNHDYAIPLFQKYNTPATIFVATGLIENPDYLTWSEIRNSPSLILFANHTWSHKNVATNLETIEKEISTADTQLTDHGVGQPKVFAYPYGLSNKNDVSILQKYGYSLAFTTQPGSTLCAKQRYALPRIRIGNTPLSSYGL